MEPPITVSGVHDLASLLVAPRESLDTELKSWLDLDQIHHQTRLAKELIALANHGGGRVIIGFHDNGEADLERPDDLSGYNTDRVNSIVARYAQPTFHVTVDIVRQPESREAYPVLTVPGNLAVPVICRRDYEDPRGSYVLRNGACYVRRPGPSSEPPRDAIEWRALLDRCIRSGRAELLDSLRHILRDPPETREQPGQSDALRWLDECRVAWEVALRDLPEDVREESVADHRVGQWEVAYSIRPLPSPEEAIGLPLLKRSLIEASNVSASGWPPFKASGAVEVVPYMGAVRGWCRPVPRRMFNDAAHTDFWMLSPSLLGAHLRGLQEDCADGREPGTVLFRDVPPYRAVEVLLHIQRLATTLGIAEGDVSLVFRYRGLTGRSLVSSSGTGWLEDARGGESRVDMGTGTTSFSLGSITPDHVGIITRLLSPIYMLFDFFELRERDVERWLATFPRRLLSP